MLGALVVLVIGHPWVFLVPLIAYMGYRFYKA